MLSGNSASNRSSISITNFSFIKSVGVTIRPPCAPNITEVLWCPPFSGWIKGNCDVSYCSNSNDSGCGGIFRNNGGDSMLAFAENLHT